MDNIKTQIAAVAIFAIVCIASLPIYFMRRKTQKMADAELKSLNPADWRMQVLFRARVMLISRLIAGMLIASVLVIKYDFKDDRAGGLLALVVFVGALSLIVSGIYGYRTQMKTLVEE